MRRLARIVAVAALLLGGVAGCGSGSAKPRSAPSSPAGPVASESYDPDRPSASTEQICSDEAAGDIQAALGVQTTQTPAGSWAASDRIYTCKYVYGAGTMTLTVKQLADAAATDAYVAGAKSRLGNPPTQNVLGNAGFAAPDGSMYVRKDFKVLYVDVSGLPATLGSHPRSYVGFAVAAVIMSCWAGN